MEFFRKMGDWSVNIYRFEQRLITVESRILGIANTDLCPH